MEKELQELRAQNRKLEQLFLESEQERMIDHNIGKKSIKMLTNFFAEHTVSVQRKLSAKERAEVQSEATESAKLHDQIDQLMEENKRLRADNIVLIDSIEKLDQHINELRYDKKKLQNFNLELMRNSIKKS